MIFTKSKTMKEITKSQINDEHYDLLDKWKSVYSGFYNEWHKISYHTIEGPKKRNMHTLNMAKVSSETLAKLIFNERVEINVADKTYSEEIENVLKTNRFYKVFQGKIEQCFALGGLVLKVNPEEITGNDEIEDYEYKLNIDYVTPDCFIPISYNSGEVTEGVFLNIEKKGAKTYCLFEFHQWKNVRDNETEETVRAYTITNELYESENNIKEDAKRVPLETLYENLDEVTVIKNLTQPLFVYLKPNIANNIDLSSPLGLSIFANALDTLYAIDVAFDSFIREFKLGKRRIIVPASSIQTTIDPQTGAMHRYFDHNDEVYQAFNFEDGSNSKIQDNTVSLRVDEHVAAINAMLNIYSIQVGFSSGTFTFDGQGVKTATEVISEKSETFQTKQVNENLIEEGLIKLVSIIGECAELYELFNKPDNDDVELHWDDSIIQDKQADLDYYSIMLDKKLLSKKYILMELLNFTEAEAERMLKEIDKEFNGMMPDIEEPELKDDNDLSDMDSEGQLGEVE